MPNLVSLLFPVRALWNSKGAALQKDHAFPLLLVVSITLAACNDNSNSEPWQMTQCFTPLHDESYVRRAELFRDEKRGCCGQRWAIPKKYLPSRLKNSTDSEQINLYFDVVRLFNPQAARVPRHARAWEHKVQIETITHAGFGAQRSLSKKLPMKGFKKRQDFIRI